MDIGPKPGDQLNKNQRTKNFGTEDQKIKTDDRIIMYGTIYSPLSIFACK